MADAPWAPVSAGFDTHELAPGVFVHTGCLPAHLLPDDVALQALWDLHPDRPAIVGIGGQVRTAPRWHQAYGHDYAFSGYAATALPIPAALRGMLDWTQAAIDPRLNGMLVNWYDAAFEHRIGQHKDAPQGRVPGSPIATISLGAGRTFQMLVSRQPVSFPTAHGTVLVIPDATNRRFAHRVPHLPGDVGRRISVTVRAFEVAAAP